jgi:hypothetical protein
MDALGRLLQKFLEKGLALYQGPVAYILAVKKQEIEDPELE